MFGVPDGLGRPRSPTPPFCQRWDLYSRVASAAAGVELRNREILVLGIGHSASDLVIGHDAMSDAIDAGAVRRALAAAGWCGDGEAAERVAGIFAKAEASPPGVIRGRRHTMIEGSASGWRWCAGA